MATTTEDRLAKIEKFLNINASTEPYIDNLKVRGDISLFKTGDTPSNDNAKFTLSSQGNNVTMLANNQLDIKTSNNVTNASFRLHGYTANPKSKPRTIIENVHLTKYPLTTSTHKNPFGAMHTSQIFLNSMGSVDDPHDEQEAKAAIQFTWSRINPKTGERYALVEPTCIQKDTNNDSSWLCASITDDNIPVFHGSNTTVFGQKKSDCLSACTQSDYIAKKFIQNPARNCQSYMTSSADKDNNSWPYAICNEANKLAYNDWSPIYGRQDNIIAFNPGYTGTNISRWHDISADSGFDVWGGPFGWFSSLGGGDILGLALA